jgi:hypothetical protein
MRCEVKNWSARVVGFLDVAAKMDWRSRNDGQRNSLSRNTSHHLC